MDSEITFSLCYEMYREEKTSIYKWTLNIYKKLKDSEYIQFYIPFITSSTFIWVLETIAYLRRKSIE